MKDDLTLCWQFLIKSKTNKHNGKHSMPVPLWKVIKVLFSRISSSLLETSAATNLLSEMNENIHSYLHYFIIFFNFVIYYIFNFVRKNLASYCFAIVISVMAMELYVLPYALDLHMAVVVRMMLMVVMLSTVLWMSWLATQWKRQVGTR